MQENEFEKQVQQKMDELKLHPSGAVWQKVEAQIKKEKRRRWALIILPLIFLGVLYGGYVIINRTHSISQIQSQAKTDAIEHRPHSKEQKVNYDSTKNNQPFLKNNDEVTQDLSSKTKGSTMIKTDPGLNIKSNYVITTNSQKDSPVAKTRLPKTMDTLESNKSNKDFKNSAEEKLISINENKPDNILKTEVPIVNDSVQKLNETSIKEENIVPVEKTTSIKNKHKWDLGFTFSAGISGTSHLFFVNGQKSFISPLNNPGNAGSSPTPSIIKSSIAFITGISAEKPISKKVKFITGLNYKLYSTTNMVGNDSASLYSRSQIRSYRNYYHFIELPAGLRFQITNGEKIKLSATTGLSISRLINSNALQFNYTTGFYNQDNSLFNKTQLGFNAGVDIAFNSKQNRSFLLGPYINYGISKLAKDGYHKYHLGFIGVKAQLFFKKK